jgi:hypothetical protein
MITPYCGICDMPVEGFQMDVVKSPYYVGFHAYCCGRTQSCRVPVEDVFRAKRNNQKLYVIVPTGRYQGLRGRARQG